LEEKNIILKYPAARSLGIADLGFQESLTLMLLH